MFRQWWFVFSPGKHHFVLVVLKVPMIRFCLFSAQKCFHLVGVQC